MILAIAIMLLLSVAGCLAAVREAFEEDTRNCC